MELWALLIAGVIGIIMTLVGVTLYVISSIGLMGFAKNRGIDNAWLAWIPIGNLYLIGRMFPGGVTLWGSRLQSLEVLLPAAAGAAILAGFLPFIGFVGRLISLALYLLLVYLCNLLFREYRPGNSLVYAIFFPIGFFLLRSARRVNVGETTRN